MIETSHVEVDQGFIVGQPESELKACGFHAPELECPGSALSSNWGRG
jgi:hypothetical protein